ncbi:unnamed protein product [Closterium sp. Naga37s-1]|nr:unnamed protein product [Closterium sp. Naga37s-1]
MRESETVSNNKRALEFTDGALDNPLSEPTRAGHVANLPFPADIYKALLSGEGDQDEEEGRGQAEEGEGEWEGEGEGKEEGEAAAEKGGGGERKGEGGRYLPCEKEKNTSISRLPPVSLHGVPRRPLYKHVAAALFRYCHAGGLPSAVLTCQGMEEKEGRREEEVGRWHGTVMDAGGRLLELIEKLCNEYSNVSGPWKEMNEFTNIKDLERMGKWEVGEQKEGGRKEGEQKEWGTGERKEGHMEERKLGERRARQLHVQAEYLKQLSGLKEWGKVGAFETSQKSEYLKQLSEGAKKVEGRCNLPPYSSIIAGDCITFNNTLTLAVQSVQAYPTFPLMLASEGLSAVLPGVEALEEGAKKFSTAYDPFTLLFPSTALPLESFLLPTLASLPHTAPPSHSPFPSSLPPPKSSHSLLSPTPGILPNPSLT